MAAKFVSVDKLTLFLEKVKALIPKDLSELGNTGGFVTKDVSDLTNYYDQSTVDDMISGFITKDVEDLTNYYTKTEVDGKIPDVSSFITAAADNLTNYYKKTETYTQTEINQKIAAIKTISIEVLEDALPETGDANKIYLKPNSGSGQNVYDEYLWVVKGDAGAWEKIGTTEVNLSNYWTKTDLTEATNEDITALFA